jgi:hypothetical protein
MSEKTVGDVILETLKLHQYVMPHRQCGFLGAEFSRFYIVCTKLIKWKQKTKYHSSLSGCNWKTTENLKPR